MTSGGRPSGSPAAAFAVVLVAHAALVVLGSAVIAIGGWKAPLPVVASFLASIPFWLVAAIGSWRIGGFGRATLGLRPLDVPLGVVAGVGAQLLLVPLIYWPVLKVLDLDTSAVEREARRVVDSAGGPVGVGLLVAMVCVAAPFVEELMYRGLLLGAFEPDRPLTGLIVSSATFAALHFQSLQFLGLFVFGLIAGLLVRRTGRLAPAVVAHVAFNTTTVVGMLLDR